MEIMVNNIVVDIEKHDRIVTQPTRRNAHPKMDQGWIPAFVKVYRTKDSVENLVHELKGE